MAQLLGVLSRRRASPRLSQASREQVLTNLSLASPAAAVGIGSLVGLTLFVTYGPLPGNPNWAAFGYPGADQRADARAGADPAARPRGTATTLDADVVVVGSGAGGGVIAGRLAAAGLDVVVLEAGGYFTEADFNQSELWGYQNLYWRGAPDADRATSTSALQAGSCLGGGTVINWTNCLRTKPWVREEWAAARPHRRRDRRVRPAPGRGLGAARRQRPLLGAQRHPRDDAPRRERARLVVRAPSPATGPGAARPGDGRLPRASATSPASKQSTLKTYLQDAVDAGARVVVRLRRRPGARRGRPGRRRRRRP